MKNSNRNPASVPAILRVHSSGRTASSATRRLSDDLLEAVRIRHGDVTVTDRDLADGIPFVDQAWIDANFTAAEDRTEAQHTTLAVSDRLVKELQDADVIVIGAPVYNFGIPAALKAWVDMIARARVTFRYTSNGPEGLLKSKKAYVIVSSGGVTIDSPVDFATPYLRQALGFVGITDVEIINVERINSRGDDALDAARMQIADLVHTQPSTRFNDSRKLEAVS